MEKKIAHYSLFAIKDLVQDELYIKLQISEQAIIISFKERT